MRKGLTRPGLYLLLATLVACGGSGGSENPAPVGYSYRVPALSGDGWDVGNAADEAVDVQQVEAMMNALQTVRFGFIDAVAVARNGTLVLDETVRTVTTRHDDWVGNTNLVLHAQFSTSKSITALAAGIALERGYLPGTDAPFLGFFNYASYANWDERKSDITLGHVLAMRAGFEWDEWEHPYESPENQLAQFYDTHVDYAKGFLDLPLSDDPGSAFAYNTVATTAVAQAIDNMAPLSYLDFLTSELFTPLGITFFDNLVTPTGLPDAGGGFYLRTRDMVKFGQLVLDDGAWRGNQVVNASWLDEMLSEHSSLQWTDPTGRDWLIDGYGYQWWLGHYELGGEVLDTRAMWGYGGQWVVVIPERQMVVAINSHAYDDSDAATAQAHALIADYLLPAAH